MSYRRKYLPFHELLVRVIGKILSEMKEIEEGLMVWDPREDWSLPFDERMELPSQVDSRVLYPLVNLGFLKAVRAGRFRRFSASGRRHYGRRVYIVCEEAKLRELQKNPPAKTWIDFMVWVKTRPAQAQKEENPLV